ncbi:MAG: cytidine deaminase [Candidatus Nanopelagicales bacterium]
MSAEDEKLLTLARSARARIQAPQGAAVRDESGRSYAAATVSLPSLQVAALDLAVAQAVAAGARGLEAVAVVGGAAPPLEVVRDLGGPGVPVRHYDSRGELVQELST